MPRDPEVRTDSRGLFFVRCPRCGTPGTKAKLVPGQYVEQRCPRRDCRHDYTVIVLPDWATILEQLGRAAS